MQSLADATGLPVDVVAVPEGAALGAAFMARCVAGLEPTMTDGRRWARTDHRVEPDDVARGDLEARYQRFRSLTAEVTMAERVPAGRSWGFQMVVDPGAGLISVAVHRDAAPPYQSGANSAPANHQADGF